MELNWLDSEHVDSRDVAGAVAVQEAARAVDSPHQLSPSTASFLAWLRHGWDGDPPQTALTRDKHGRVVGVLEVWLGHWDNPQLGFISVTVDPLARRQGIGRQLFEVGMERVRADGRTLLASDCFDRPWSVAFLEAMGLKRVSVELERWQDLLDLDWDRLDQEYELAEQQAAGYELIRLAGPIPEHLMADVLRMSEAINDAPTDDWEIEDEVFSPERLRAFEAAQEALQRRVYRVIARERSTGELAGHTVVGVEGEWPWFGRQYDTSVLRAHRGHRLGRYLKVGMLRWLQAAEPQLRTIGTWNSASNDHMIAINELLGYRVVGTGLGYQRRLDS
ncbi:MAG: GNAT family N-acetyltransferase [Sporichthyaceae bacterium]|nr:GNAT family N-acetyltransferase [Sporichthyaceae bacterium]